VIVVDLSGRQSRPSGAHAVAVASVTNINEVLDRHVALEVECVDRLYLNGHVPGPVANDLKATVAALLCHLRQQSD
jgi:hypothetical protein